MIITAIINLLLSNLEFVGAWISVIDSVFILFACCRMINVCDDFCCTKLWTRLRCHGPKTWAPSPHFGNWLQLWPNCSALLAPEPWSILNWIDIHSIQPWLKICWLELIQPIEWKKPMFSLSDTTDGLLAYSLAFSQTRLASHPWFSYFALQMS